MQKQKFQKIPSGFFLPLLQFQTWGAVTSTYAVRTKIFAGIIFDDESAGKFFFRNSNFLVILGISVDTNHSRFIKDRKRYVGALKIPAFLSPCFSSKITKKHDVFLDFDVSSDTQPLFFNLIFSHQ